MQKSPHLLVLRFSALGDVAMVVPILKLALAQHPTLQITMVSVPFMKPLFTNIPRLTFLGVDVKQEYKGIAGIIKIAKEIRKNVHFTAIADLHFVMRTRLLSLLLFKKVVHINKGRKEKRELTRSKNKILRQLPTSFERYATVFERLGYAINLDQAQPEIVQKVIEKNTHIIGIAPFAKHHAKMYPLVKMEELVKLLSQNVGVQILIFGTKTEMQTIQHWEKYSQVKIIAGQYSFAQELDIIATLSLMVSMDSANMHLASLYNIPVISIWGATHPFAGFYGWGQLAENAIMENLHCRPSSVFGNKICPVHGIAGCMQNIYPKDIYAKIKNFLSF